LDFLDEFERAVLVPVAIWLGVSSLLLAQVSSSKAGLHSAGFRSSALVRGRWLRVASLVGVGALLAIAAGPLLGALLILVADATLPVLNLVAGVVDALAMLFVALGSH
jgi:hypothetical protein